MVQKKMAHLLLVLVSCTFPLGVTPYLSTNSIRSREAYISIVSDQVNTNHRRSIKNGHIYQFSSDFQSDVRPLVHRWRRLNRGRPNLSFAVSNDDDESTISSTNSSDDLDKKRLSRVREGMPATIKSKTRGKRKFKKITSKVSNDEIQYLETATKTLLNSTIGTLSDRGRWHQVVSVLMAWSKYSKSHPDVPIFMESLLQLLVDEKNSLTYSKIEVTAELYNAVIDAWVCAAFFQKNIIPPHRASQRVREIISSMQDNYERSILEKTTTSTKTSTKKGGSGSGGATPAPDRTSFALVLHCVCRIEGAFVARRVLAWMEYLTKSEKNIAAQPTRTDYVMVLDSYVALRDKNTPYLTEGFIRHMNAMYNNNLNQLTTNNNDLVLGGSLHLPDTYCYNILLKSWNQQVGRAGRLVAEQADRILDEMKSSGLAHCQPDLITYSSVICAWAASGMKAHAVSRAEALLREIEESPDLEVNRIVLNAVMSAWIKSRIPASVSRTEEILRQMEDFAAASSSSTGTTAADEERDINVTAAKPDLISYNTHLHALSIHSVKIPRFAQKAEELLQKLEDKYDNGLLEFGPNTFTYNLALESLSRATLYSKDTNFINVAATKAAFILRKLVKRENVDPDVYSFNQVLSVLSRSSSPGCAKTAVELLNYMNNTYYSGVHPLAKPNTDSYYYVISAYTRNPSKASAEHAESLLIQMKHQYLDNNDKSVKPTQACYNAIIDCWAKSGEGTLGARKAEALLYDMQYQYEVLGDKSMTPTLMTFNAVLNAWAKSGTRCCGYKAEQYLKKMWDMYNAGDSNFTPNDFSYNTVIDAISKSKNAGKAQKALRVLRKMDKLYRAGNKDTRPNEITYTAVLNSCAFPATLDAKTRRKALDTAMFTLKELQQSQSYGQPNQVTYGTYIKACRNLLGDDEALRRDVIKKAFEECVKDGQVGQMVLNYVPNDVVSEVLKGYYVGTDITVDNNRRITLQNLPDEWKCNARIENEWKTTSYSSTNRQKRQQNKSA